MTIHQRGLTSRACSQVRRITERYLRLTEKLLHEQRRNLMKLPLGIGGEDANASSGAADP